MRKSIADCSPNIKKGLKKLFGRDAPETGRTAGSKTVTN